MGTTLSLDRTDRITGSRIARVLGVSPYIKGPDAQRTDVLREMVREHFLYDAEFGGNMATEWGQEHELDAIADYELVTGLRVEKTGAEQETVIGGPLNGCAVTPDGWVVSDVVKATVEVKAPFRAMFTTWQERPDHEQQIRLVAEVCDLERVDFGVWRPSGIAVTEMPRDKDREGNDYDWLRSKVREDGDTVIGEIERYLELYAQIIELGEDDPQVKPYLEGEPGVRYDAEWVSAEQVVLELMAEAERLGEQLAGAKHDLELLSPTRSSKGPGLHLIYRSASAGGSSTSWKAVAEELAVKLADQAAFDVIKKKHTSGTAGKGPGYAYKRLGEK